MEGTDDDIYLPVPAAERRFGRAPLKAPLDELVVIAMGLAIAKGVAADAGRRTILTRRSTRPIGRTRAVLAQRLIEEARAKQQIQGGQLISPVESDDDSSAGQATRRPLAFSRGATLSLSRNGRSRRFSVS